MTANTKIQEVYNYEVEGFKGTPACTITPSDNIGEYITNEENVRLYVFNIRLYINRNVAPAGIDVESNADKIMRGLVDSVLDDLDKNYTLTGITNPTGYTFINLFAIPSAWGYAGRESEYRVAEIKATARVCIDLQNIS